MSRRRALVAGLLGMVVYPGLGHLYLREWLRALAWVGLAIATASLVVPESSIEAVRTGGLAVVPEVSRDLPTSAVAAMLLVRALTTIDAVLIALSVGPASPSQPSGATCPNCGRELDGDIDFCHWCTTRVEHPTEDGTQSS